MKPQTLTLLLVMICLACPTSFCKAQSQSRKRTFVPGIARLLGVRVGYNGQKALERLLGEGLHQVGGHPNSRESWRTHTPLGAVDTDGFSLNDEGYVLESLEWMAGDANHSDTTIPWARKLPRYSGWLGTVNLGMTKRDVMRLTRRKLPPPAVRGDTWTWRESGFLVPKLAQGPDAFQQWTAVLEFTHGRLVSIAVDCE